MQPYRPHRPAPAFALAAAALSAGALMLAVYLPAQPALPPVVPADRVEVAIEPASIDVIGVRPAGATRAHVDEARAPLV